jgi:exonuclease III
MSDIYKIILNINGLSTRTRMKMLEEFLRKQDIDILFLQKVTHHEFDTLRGYTAHTNVGTTERDAAMLTREGITLTKVTRLPSGQGMAAEYRGIWLLKSYAPSGEAMRHERKSF